MSLLQFRAWNKKTQSFIDYGDLVLDLRSGKIYAGDIGLVESTIDVTDQIELMQSTGMKDKNGVDVYQGDIIRCTRGCHHEVIWLEEYGGTFFGGMPAWYLSGLSNGYAWTGREEVIGNIYENSELLEEQR
ncbi:YopX family protein [Enterococcus faecium]|nr:YopX family protein [Enterococcus faecium]MCH3594968.1 YopX family protein [Enterococcus faecium]MCH3619979.1 YopX family protein [Enterococcus faecium]MCH3685810.1 YopX family protein [Enterococcus faecium]